MRTGFSLNMPSNYIPWGGAIAAEKQQEKFAAALDKIDSIAKSIQANEVLPPERGNWLMNKILSALYHLAFPHVQSMDKSFWADEKCTGCGICKKICPARNISLYEGKPLWHHFCHQCFACLQWCPEEAIQYGTNTEKRKRYRHPEIKLSDMLAAVRRRPF